MPTIKGIPGPYRFFFYSFDCNERRHVHAQRERASCKFWIDPVELAASNAFSRRELNDIRRIILEYRQRIVEAWSEHCGEI